MNGSDVTAPDLVWNRYEAAARLKISLRKLDQLTADGVLPSFRIGERRLFRERDLQDFVARRVA